jgi:long-chain fatty acid transport protein
MKKTLSLLALVAAGSAQAAGFQINTQGSRSTGMGNASAAFLEDSSAIYYNPANILGVQKLDITLGDTGILPRFKFTPTGGETQGQKTTLSPPPHAFATYRVMDKLAVGFGIYTPFGARSRWVDDFVARGRALESALAVYNFTPTVAYQVHERIRVGAGVNVGRGTLEIKRALDFVESEGRVHLGGASWGIGATAGIQGVVVPKLLTVGLSYRSPIKFNFEGRADFQNVPAEFEPRLPDTRIAGEVSTPGMFAGGIAVTPLERLTVAFDVNLVQWGSFKQLAIEFPDNPALNNPLPKAWKDTANYHLGVEYGVTDALQVRAGFVYDPSPSPPETLTPDLPDFDRTAYSVGAGYRFGSFRADVGYQYIALQDNESTAPGISGTYSGYAQLLSLTLGYSM